MNRRITNGRAFAAFTLVEMLVATALASVLIGADLIVMSRLSKDRQLIAERSPSNISRGLADLLRFDLQQANAIDNPQPNTLTLTGHGSINRTTLLPDQRWVEVGYHIVITGGKSSLWRSQDYLDDPTRPDHWEEWITDGITGLQAQKSDAAAGGEARFQIDTLMGGFTVETRQ